MLKSCLHIFQKRILAWLSKTGEQPREMYKIWNLRNFAYYVSYFVHSAHVEQQMHFQVFAFNPVVGSCLTILLFTVGTSGGPEGESMETQEPIPIMVEK